MEQIRLVDIANIKFSVGSVGRIKMQEKPTKWLSGANLLRNNIILYETLEEHYFSDKELLIRAGDIIVKRIAPTFVNYVDYIADEVYAGNNLIIVTPKQEVYSKYIAMLLNEKIQTLSESSSVGAVMKSVSRPHLDDFTIPLIPYEKQVLVGDLWYGGIELEKMRIRLAELESIKRNYQIKKYVETFGGRKNG